MAQIYSTKSGSFHDKYRFPLPDRVLLCKSPIGAFVQNIFDLA